MNNYVKDFILNPEIIFLNHGSFGATPRIVMELYQKLQMEMERQPVEFLGRKAPDLLRNSRQILANYLGTSCDNLVYVTNTTVGINIIAHSLDLRPNDEVLATNQEYGALDRTWKFLAQKKGFTYINQIYSSPIHSEEELLSEFIKGLSDRTKVIYISHITSPTAMIFPIQKMIDCARQRNILTIVDGAHAPGQLHINLNDLDVDFYVGNLHKWLCAPKGSAFLYSNPRVQHLIEPLVVSWGWQSDNPSSSQFVDYLEWQGTRDISAFLAVPAAIEYQQRRNWDQVRMECHSLASLTYDQITQLTNLPPLYSNKPSWFSQMVALPLPDSIHPAVLKDRLYDEFQIEIPVISWNGQTLIRASFQIYNNISDVECLVSALRSLLLIS